MDKKEYVVVTDGKEVAGLKSPGKGKKIALTALQAEHPLRIGHISDPNAPVVEEVEEASGGSKGSAKAKGSLTVTES